MLFPDYDCHHVLIHTLNIVYYYFYCRLPKAHNLHTSDLHAIDLQALNSEKLIFPLQEK
jgi:hypothetical protein